MLLSFPVGFDDRPVGGVAQGCREGKRMAQVAGKFRRIQTDSGEGLIYSSIT